MHTSDVLFNLMTTHDGSQIGQITLNRPKALNALSTQMCRAIHRQLDEWDRDADIVAIVIHGAGEKGLCAGGDVRALHEARKSHHTHGENNNNKNVVSGAYDFFTSEYAMDAKLHAMSKPVIVWGDGIVMGGGMGIFMGGSHRIVTETTKFAMPEVTIGLFPDATGSWFLQRFPADTGLFMGLTGAVGNANDAIFANVANYQASSHDFKELLDTLEQANWRQEKWEYDNDIQHSHKNSLSKNTLNTNIKTTQPLHNIVSKTLSNFCQNAKKDVEFQSSQLAKFWQPIGELMNAGSLSDINAVLQSDTKLNDWFKNSDINYASHSFLTQAVANYRHGCPVTICLTYTIYQSVKTWSLKDILEMETNVALNCIKNSDFSEGVRALLIDKDKSPEWSRTLADCLTANGQAYINSHFFEVIDKTAR